MGVPIPPAGTRPVDNTPKFVDKAIPLWTVGLKYAKELEKNQKPHPYMWPVPCRPG